MVCPWLESVSSLWKCLQLEAVSQTLSFLLGSEFSVKGGSEWCFSPLPTQPLQLFHLLPHLWSRRLMSCHSEWCRSCTCLNHLFWMLPIISNLKAPKNIIHTWKWTWTCTFILFSTGTLSVEATLTQKLFLFIHTVWKATSLLMWGPQQGNK